MRSTVGPLPPAVYWRRRALVLGALLLVVLLVVWACSGGSDDPGGRPDAGGPTPTPTSSAPDPNASASGPLSDPEDPPPGQPPDQVAPPGAGDPAQTADPGASASAAPGTGGEPAVPAAAPPADGSCADEEVLVTPVPERTRAQRGQTINIRLKIKNVSQRTCTRDVGADLQEVYIKQGAQKVWSSDVCGAARGSEVLPFSPNFEREYFVAWNGRDSSRCSGNAAAGPIPAAGEFEVFGRLGSRLSAPVKLTLTG